MVCRELHVGKVSHHRNRVVSAIIKKIKKQVQGSVRDNDTLILKVAYDYITTNLSLQKLGCFLLNTKKHKKWQIILFLSVSWLNLFTFFVMSALRIMNIWIQPLHSLLWGVARPFQSLEIATTTTTYPPRCHLLF